MRKILGMFDVRLGVKTFRKKKTKEKTDREGPFSTRGPLLRETKDTVKVSLQEYLFTGSWKGASCGIWQKRVGLSNLLEGGLAVLQEPALTVLLVLPIYGGGRYSHLSCRPLLGR